MKLLIVIVSYRVTDLTIDCLRSLEDKLDEVPGTRVALCENGTGGDAEERLRRAIDENGWNPWVELTAIYPNRGFTGGNNAVIRPALESDDPPEYVLLLNADTIVLDHALDSLVAFMDAHPRAGVAGSLLLSTDGEAQGSPFRFPGIATELDRGLRLGLVTKLLSPWNILFPKADHPGRVDWVAGASMILRRTMLDEIGLLDEGLYTYFDDSDICLRAERAGWETWYVPESRITHLEGASTGHRDRPGPAPAAAILVPGPPAVLAQEPRRPVHGPGRRGVHPRPGGLAAPASDPAQARRRPAPHARRFHPAQRLRRRLQGPRGRESGDARGGDAPRADGLRRIPSAGLPRPDDGPALTPPARLPYPRGRRTATPPTNPTEPPPILLCQPERGPSAGLKPRVLRRDDDLEMIETGEHHSHRAARRERRGAPAA